MNTVRKNFSARRYMSLLCLVMMITLLVSCNNDPTPDFSADDQESLTFDAKDDYYFDDADDIIDVALAAEASTGNGRQSQDARLNCAQMSFSGSDDSGTLIVDFGEGCVDAQGNRRSGAIVVERHGTSHFAGSHWSFSFADYAINGIKVEGTRSVTVISVTDSLVVSDVTLVGGKITWPDGRVARREANHRRHHLRHENHLLDRLIIYGNAQGTWCNGRGYFIEITEPLIYDRSCANAGVIIPVSGKKLIKHGDREFTVDYGTGTCDNTVTLTFKDGKTVRYEVN